MTAFRAKNARGLLNLTLLAVLHLVTFYGDKVRSAQSKSFRRATNRCRTELCPSDPTDQTPYATIEADKLDLPEVNTDDCLPPPDALCSWKCTLEPNCTSFVWRANANLCAFYSSAPQTCSEVGSADDCIHFESNIYGQTSCGSEVLSITADNVITHLYIDGCEVDATDLPNRAEWQKTDNVTLSLTAILIAVEINNVDDVGGLLASTDTFQTDGTWKITTNYTSGWMDINFDDSSWSNATTYGYNGAEPWKTRPGISDIAQWLAGENEFGTTVYYRYHLKCDAV